MADDDGLPPWKVDENDTRSIKKVEKDVPFSDDFFPADWKPKKEREEKIKIDIPLTQEVGAGHTDWFSNFKPFDTPLVYQGFSFETNESFYVAMKTKDEGLREKISKMKPGEAKRFGRSLALRDDWGTVKMSVMEHGLRHKFFPGTSWHKQLMETGDEEIVEWNSWHDVFWGKDVETGSGQNHLGKLLMKLRSEYKNTKVINKSSGENGISIMRGTIFGNKFTHIKDRATLAEFIVETREESIVKYKEDFEKRIRRDKDFRRAVQKLRGEVLLCCCAPLPCHGQVIVDWLFKNIDID